MHIRIGNTASVDLAQVSAVAVVDGGARIKLSLKSGSEVFYTRFDLFKSPEETAANLIAQLEKK